MNPTRLDAILRIIQDTIDNDSPPGEAIASLEALARYAQNKQIPLVEAMTKRLTPTKNRNAETESIPSLIIIAFDPTMNAALRLTSMRQATKHSTFMSFTDHLKAVLIDSDQSDQNKTIGIDDYLKNAFENFPIFADMDVVMEIIRQSLNSKMRPTSRASPSKPSENQTRSSYEKPEDTRPPGLFQDLAEGDSLRRSYSISNVRRTIKKSGEVKIRFDAISFPDKNYSGKDSILNIHSHDANLYDYIEKKAWSPPNLCITKTHGRAIASLVKEEVKTTSP